MGSFLLCFDGKREDMTILYVFVEHGKTKKKTSTPSQVLLEGSGQQFWLLDGGAPTASRSAPVYHSKARSVGVVMTVPLPPAGEIGRVHFLQDSAPFATLQQMGPFPQCFCQNLTMISWENQSDHLGGIGVCPSAQCMG